METLKDRCNQVLQDLLDSEYHFYASGYVEPGYQLREPARGVIFADWNEKSRWNEDARRFDTIDDTMPRLARVAEWLGYEVQWCDEWVVCDECGEAFRCEPNSYSWTQYGWIHEGATVCGDCVKEDPSEYLEYLTNQVRVDTIGLDLEAAGLVRVDERFEHGLYGGQDASPDAILATLKAASIDQVVFGSLSVGQFDTAFSVWVPADQVDEATAALADGNTRCAVDPAKAMEAALKEATRKMADLPAEADGIRYAKCHEDGSAEVRIIGPQEFLDGIRD